MMSFSVSCTLKPKLINVTPDANKIKRKISVSSDDFVTASVVCTELEKAEIYEQVRCEKPQNENTDLILRIETVIKNSSSDYWRNSRISLYTLATLLLVTTSADIKYYLTFMDRGQVLRSFTISSRGRIGVWAIQPVLMGYIGLSLGTIFNGDKLPDHLHRQCNAIVNTASLAESQNCLAYQRFIQDSLSYVWKDFLEIQAQLLEIQTKKVVSVTENIGQL